MSDKLNDVNWNNVADILRRQPRGYQAYGAYWWTVKQLLRDHGVDMGGIDDKAARGAVMREHKSARAAWYAAVDHSHAHTQYGFRNGAYHLPDGTPYELDDPDMFAQATKL